MIDDNDLHTKASQAEKFLEKGYRVKLVVRFKQRENAHKKEGFTAMNKLIAKLGDKAEVERPPSFEGNTIMARLDAKKENKGKSKTDESQGSGEGAGRDPDKHL